MPGSPLFQDLIAARTLLGGIWTPSKGPGIDSRLEGVNRAKLKFTNINTTTSRVSVRNKNESAREGAKQILSK
jgi:hypothetical protein